ncbi:colanic acid biosynthesis protein [Microbacterium trichothecenolyticum]|uniref:Colanic acid biosynthesis protein n=2 Tax=Microbacterium trichothecenolyticum TaxID=69370 RepID=A0A0M2H705_MICTR|nr:colanic acid biosynthesis protein [Microbacterium trichothecenolyticum]
MVDRIFLNIAPDTHARDHVLIAPPGRGNIGDQALVEAFVEAVAGHVHVVVRSDADVLVPEHLEDRMTTVPLPALVYGTAIGRARDLRTLATLLAGARSFSVIGADVMDGAYVERASVSRSLLARRAAELGYDSRIVGFSWNKAPSSGAKAALRAASDAGVALYLRDPYSADRARVDGLRVRDAADIVFTAGTRDDDAVARWIPDLEPDGRLALVNASGLVGAAVDAYTETVALLRGHGYRVAIIPHVSRHGADDLPLCRTIAERFEGDDGVTLIPRLLSPGEVRGLGARADIAVTGRMHLAVMSLMAGTPAVTVATQGKVEGLMSLFGTPQLCVEPGDGFERRLRGAVVATLSDLPRMRAAIGARVADVVGLAWANVAGLRAEVKEGVR